MKESTEFGAFDNLVRQVLSVSREELLKREAEYKKRAALNPHKRGPKPKRKSAEAHGPADQLPA
jgi:hypothetical protein